MPDYQGTSRQLADAAQHVTDTLLTDSWGLVLATSGSAVNPFGPFGQSGYYHDGGSALYVRARHLRTDLGRWLSKLAPQTDGPDAMLYPYMENRPLAFFDPSGLDCTNHDFNDCFWQLVMRGVTTYGACVRCGGPKKKCDKLRPPRPLKKNFRAALALVFSACTPDNSQKLSTDCCQDIAATLANILAAAGVTAKLGGDAIAKCCEACDGAVGQCGPGGSADYEDAFRGFLACIKALTPSISLTDLIELVASILLVI